MELESILYMYVNLIGDYKESACSLLGLGFVSLSVSMFVCMYVCMYVRLLSVMISSVSHNPWWLYIRTYICLYSKNTHPTTFAFSISFPRVFFSEPSIFIRCITLLDLMQVHKWDTFFIGYHVIRSVAAPQIVSWFIYKYNCQYLIDITLRYGEGI